MIRPPPAPSWFDGVALFGTLLAVWALGYLGITGARWLGW